MPSRCCIPNCLSAHRKASVFSFPRDAERRRKWISAIPSRNFSESRKYHICSEHFLETDIIREDILESDGLPVKRTKCLLRKDAVPSKGLGLAVKRFNVDHEKLLHVPAIAGSSHRNDPFFNGKELLNPLDARRTAVFEASLPQEQQELLQEDRITSILDVVHNISKVNLKSWHFLKEGSRILFYKLGFQSGVPEIERSFLVNSDLSVDIFVGAKKKYFAATDSILGKEFKCNLYSKINKLIDFIDAKEMTEKDIRDNILNDLSKLIDKNSESETNSKLKFLHSQFLILFSDQVRYAADDILFFSFFYFTFPAAYKYFRDTGMLTMPHPTYIERHIRSRITTKHLKEKFILLKPHEKYINLLLEDVYVKPKPNKAKKLEGFAQHSVDLSETTVHTFMITSILSSNKDIVGLFPVKNLDADFLYNKTLEILKVLHDIGFEVISIISDNSHVNIKAFEQFSPINQLQLFIDSPYVPGKKIFFLFDSVHLVKSFLNDWLDEETQTFLFPSIDDYTRSYVADFSVLKSLNEKERPYPIKLAPSLTQKSLLPSSVERQSVALVTKVFREQTIEAIKRYEPDAFGTLKLIEIILKWWTIVNVKHPNKGNNFRNSDADPIRSIESSSFQFLSEFTQWLNAWEDSKQPHQRLTSSTYTALIHTTGAFVFLTRYLLEDLNFPSVLLGKFQTDPLVYRFGKNMEMSETS